MPVTWVSSKEQSTETPKTLATLLSRWLDLGYSSFGKLSVDTAMIVNLFYSFYSNFVPISLLVTLEMVKFFQGSFMQYDVEMFDDE